MAWSKSATKAPATCRVPGGSVYPSSQVAAKRARAVSRKFGGTWDPIICRVCGGWHLKERR